MGSIRCKQGPMSPRTLMVDHISVNFIAGYSSIMSDVNKDQAKRCQRVLNVEFDRDFNIAIVIVPPIQKWWTIVMLMNTKCQSIFYLNCCVGQPVK